jgi:hypothetical protein
MEQNKATETSQSATAVACHEDWVGEAENMAPNALQTPVTAEPPHENLNVDELEARIREIEENAGSDTRMLITQLTNLAKPILVIEHDLQTSFQFNKCEIAVKIGTIVNKIYPLVTAELKWEPWMKKHFSGVSASTIKNCRDIASRPDCYPYFHLGEARVLKLISLTRKDKWDNRIQTFLVEHGIDYDPNENLSLEMKAKIDVVLKEAKEANQKPKEPVSVAKLTDNLQKSVDNFVKAIGQGAGDLDAEKKAQLAAILQELLEKLAV